MSEDDVFVQCHDGLVRLPLKAARACGTLDMVIPQASDERAVIPIPDVKYEDLKELMAFEPPSDWVSAGEQVSRLGKLADFLLFEKFLRYCANAIWSVPISRMVLVGHMVGHASSPMGPVIPEALYQPSPVAASCRMRRSNGWLPCLVDA